jgi:phosphatidate cytidylyltransferase
MLISNPLTSSLFFPLSSVFSALLGCGLLGVTIARTFVQDTILRKQLLLRWASWAVIAPMTVLALLSGKLVFAALSSVLALVGTLEYCKMSSRSRADQIVLSVLALLLPVVAAYQAQLLPVIIFLGAILLILVSFNNNSSFEQSAVSLLGMFYVPLLASFSTLILGLQNGPAILISVISASALGNIAAFVFGKLFAGPKLAPKISPNKTWSGVLGSVLGSFVGFVLLSSVSGMVISNAAYFVLPVVVALFGVLGDLFESQLKRSFQTKDAGTWLPGFGGLLDRVDGLLFVMPAVFFILAAGI